MSTVKIRACVAVGPDGQWCVSGYFDEQDRETLDAMKSDFGWEKIYHWIECEVPAYPEPETVEAEVVG